MTSQSSQTAQIPVSVPAPRRPRTRGRSRRLAGSPSTFPLGTYLRLSITYQAGMADGSAHVPRGGVETGGKGDDGRAARCAPRARRATELERGSAKARARVSGRFAVVGPRAVRILRVPSRIGTRIGLGRADDARLLQRSREPIQPGQRPQAASDRLRRHVDRSVTHLHRRLPALRYRADPWAGPPCASSSAARHERPPGRAAHPIRRGLVPATPPPARRQRR